MFQEYQDAMQDENDYNLIRRLGGELAVSFFIFLSAVRGECVTTTQARQLANSC